MKITSVLFSFFIIAAFSSELFARFGEPPCASWTRADAVFSGKVLKIENVAKGEGFPEGSRKIRFQVLQNFKGADNPTFALVTKILVGTDGFNIIKKGETWIVYAQNDIVGKSFTEFRRTKIEPKVTNEELETLKNIIAGKTSAAISGQIDLLSPNNAGDYEPVEITVEGGGKRLTATTGADGAFNLAVPSEGVYKVALKFPYSAGLKWDENLLGTSYTEGIPTFFKYEVRLNDGDCNYSFFEVLKKTQ